MNVNDDIVEVNIICINYHNYRFQASDIDEVYNEEKSFRIKFKDGSQLQFLRNNIICVEYNTKEGMNK